MKRSGSANRRGQRRRGVDLRGDRPRTRSLHGPGQQPVAEPERDPVHHDRIHDFVRAGCGLEVAGNRTPDSADGKAAEDGEGQVNVPGPADQAIAYEGRAQRAHQELALSTDVEEAGPEAKGDRQAGKDIGRRGGQALGNGPESGTDCNRITTRQRRGHLGHAAEGAVEQCAVGGGDSCPGGAQGCARTLGERCQYQRIREHDHESADDQPGQHGKKWDHDGLQERAASCWRLLPVWDPGFRRLGRRRRCDCGLCVFQRALLSASARRPARWRRARPQPGPSGRPQRALCRP